MSDTDPQIILLDQALTLALSIGCDATKAETLEGLAVAYAEAGQPARAAAILRRVWQMARGLPDASDRQSQLPGLRKPVSRRTRRRWPWPSRPILCGLRTGPASRRTWPNTMKAGRLPQAQAHLAEALAWVRRAEEAGEGASFTRSEIAETAVDLGLIEHAVQVASAMDRHGSEVQALCAVAVRCAQTWQHAAAAAIFDQALLRVAALPCEAD
jgi:hypothetical protein